jgi:hypothetical protein
MHGRPLLSRYEIVQFSVSCHISSQKSALKLLKRFTILAAYDSDKKVFVTIVSYTDSFLRRLLSVMNF